MRVGDRPCESGAPCRYPRSEDGKWKSALRNPKGTARKFFCGHSVLAHRVTDEAA